MDHSQIERRKCERDYVNADTKDKREGSGYFENDGGRVCSSEEDRPVQGGVDDMRLEAIIDVRKRVSAHDVASRQTVAPTKPSAATMFAAPIMIAIPIIA